MLAEVEKKSQLYNFDFEKEKPIKGGDFEYEVYGEKAPARESIPRASLTTQAETAYMDSRPSDIFSAAGQTSSRTNPSIISLTDRNPTVSLLHQSDARPTQEFNQKALNN